MYDGRRDGGPRLGIDELGHGEPALLLLTGWCSSRARWALAAPRLAARRRVVNFEWRGHGDSERAEQDFGLEELVRDALAVVAASGLHTFIPCSASHSGWVAIELRRRLGDRVPAIVHLDWMVTEPSSSYMQLIGELQSEQRWPNARDALFEIWRAGDERGEISDAIAVMRQQGGDMWLRSGREIEASYGRHGSPLRALAALAPPPRVLHLYGQPDAQDYLDAQQRFASAHSWFTVRRVPARTHFSMIETPAEVAAAIEEFASGIPEPVLPTGGRRA
jgi:pimeloyl-ACP methyl ester carboxylesterase